MARTCSRFASGPWHPVLAGLLVGLLGVWPAPAQEPGAPPAVEEEQPAFDTGMPEAEELDRIDDILAGEELMLAGEGYGYDPGDRRDPFKSLLEARTRPTIRGQRPEGIPGLLIDDVDLKGTFIMPDGPIAQVQSADKDQSFLLRVGDQLFDGDVVSITQNEIVFKQLVDDPTAIKPFREVVKKLNS